MSDLGLHAKFYSTTASGRGPCARGVLTLCDAICINFTLWQNKDGSLRLGLPSTPNPKFDESQAAEGKNRKFYDEVFFKFNEDKTSPARDEITDFIVGEYEKATASPSSAGNGSIKRGSTFNEPIPF